ncbi:MAG TPA: SRPBCC family protein [Solirubrobacterales bacterium]
MKPVTVTTSIDRPREEVFAFLDELSNHASFTDHFLVDWEFTGPARGVGAKGSARISAPGSQDWTEFEVVDAKRPDRIVEEGVGANGKRRTRGSYYLSDRPGGGTDVAFELEWLAAPRSERLIPPLSRAFIRRSNGKSLRRLKKQLEKGQPA